MTEADGPTLAELTNPEHIADLAESMTMSEGSALASTDSVELLEMTPHTARARVHDQDYDVDVNLASSQSGLKTWCSCGAKSTICRHATATALTAWQELRHGERWHKTEH
jgi:uncharacterized Zn finger protein